MSEKELQVGDIQPIVFEIGEVLTEARSAAVASVNTTLLDAYWKIGQILVRYEQNNQARATYGTKLLAGMAKLLSQKYGKGFPYPTFSSCAAFTSPIQINRQCLLN